MSKKSKSLKSYYEVPLSIVIFMLIVYYLSGQDIFIKIAFGVGLLSLLSDTFVDYLSLVWGKILAAFGFINSHILLSLIFFLVLFPISVLYRFFKKDSLNMGQGKDTYYTDRGLTYTSKDIENPW